MSNNRVGITMTDELLKDVDSWASQTGISRSAAICVLVKQALMQYEITYAMQYAVNKDKNDIK